MSLRIAVPPLAVGLCWSLALHAPARADRDTTLSLPGLDRPARIVTDRHGIPHLWAESTRDLYFVWGFVTARDRMWQLEHSRRAARGDLWEWFGNRALRADGGAQLFELAERAERLWARERRDPRVREPLERYAAGINAYFELCRRDRRPWPTEFLRIGRRPGPWRPQDAYLVLLAQGLLLDLDLPELEEAQAIREYGSAWLRGRRRFERDWTFATIPDSVAARLYGRRRDPASPASPAPRVPRGGSRGGPESRPPGAGEPPGAGDAARVPGPPRLAGLPPGLVRQARAALSGWLPEVTRDPESRASNAFAVGPGLSASGAPLLANDPHLALGTPGPLHAVHLSVPGVLQAAGASVPGLPLLVSGRNDVCAWGLTSLAADVVDVYADTLSRDGRSVRWRGGWAPVREADYRMRYRALGFLPLPTFGQKRRYTPRGPILALDRRRGVALSVRWAGSDEQITLGRLLGIERLGGAPEIAEALRTLVTPTHNFLVADRAGRVIYQAAGALPRRGFVPPPGPLPGDGRHEWLGLIAPEDMPRWELGPRDFVVNGNNLPVGSHYPEPLGRYEFMQDRAARMAQRLAGRRKVTIEDLRSVQNDLYSRGAERFVPRLLRCADSLLASLGPEERAALDTLRAWDFVTGRERRAPTLFRGWLGALQRRSRLEGLGGGVAAALDGRAPELLRQPASQAPERAAVAAVEALRLALSELEKRLGPHRENWTWGRAHRARFRHALAWKDSTLQPAPVAVDGDNSTVCVGRSNLPWSPLVTFGPVWRHLVDLAVAESSLCVLPPGNAAQEPHARDHLLRWANHGYVPLYLDWARIERAKETEWRLAPAPPRAPGVRRGTRSG